MLDTCASLCSLAELCQRGGSFILMWIGLGLCGDLFKEREGVRFCSSALQLPRAEELRFAGKRSMERIHICDLDVGLRGTQRQIRLRRRVSGHK
jgi:hypothetical protein